MKLQPTKVAIILFVYLSARLGQSFLPILQSDVQALTKNTNTNIVALLVDKDLYQGSLKNRIDRYAQTYIQGRLSDTKAVIFPLNTKTIKARDISKLLENLYYHGVNKEGSTLQGVILIGDQVPLPVVNNNEKIFPSIFPYTDFDDAKYYRDPTSSYFVNNNKEQAEPEIRHSVINIGVKSQDYINFFDKVKKYYQNPQGYIGDKIWYDDLIDQKNTFNNLMLPYYINNFLFAEDIAYHRYNPILIDILNTIHNTNIGSLFDEGAALSGEVGSYESNTAAVFSGLIDSLQQNEDSTAVQTPTVFVDDSLQGFMKPYSELYGAESQVRMRDNVLGGGRRDLNKIDSHTNKITLYDNLYTKTLGTDKVPLLVETNKIFEQKLIQATKENQYAMRLPIPTRGEVNFNKFFKQFFNGLPLITKVMACTISPNNTDFKRLNEVYYYGKPAIHINNIDETTIFRGSSSRLSGSNLAIPLQSDGRTLGASQQQSLGGSYSILNQFIEANRGYNTDNALPDGEILEDIQNGKKKYKCKDNLYTTEYRGNNTPFALEPDNKGGLVIFNKDYTKVGTTQDPEGQALLSSKLKITLDEVKKLPGAIYDIAGSYPITDIKERMLGSGLLHAGTIINTMRYKNLLASIFNFSDDDKIVLSPCADEPRETLNVGEWDLEKTLGKRLSLDDTVLSDGYRDRVIINGPGGTTESIVENQCLPNLYFRTQTIFYKTIDSTSIHNAPNPEQISGFTLTTLSRPIDSVRYLSFKGIGGNRVKLQFPNIYHIPVYKNGNSTGSLILKSVPEIRQSIIEYLQQSVDQYNQTLTQELNKSSNYFNTQTAIFTKLQQVDPLATPARSYQLLDRNFFVNSVDDTLLDGIAQILYTTNRILPHKNKTTTVIQELEQILEFGSINNKKETILQDYLSKKTNYAPLAFPGYQSSGYEMIALVSDTRDDVSNYTIPESIALIQQLIEKDKEQQSIIDSLANDSIGSGQDAIKKKDACTSQYGEPVPIFDIQGLSSVSFPWIDALGCWLKNLKAPKITIDFKNSQGPVIIPDFLRSIRDTSDTQEEWKLPLGLGNENSTGTSSSQKDILSDFISSLSSQVYIIDPSTPQDLQPQLILEHKGKIIGDLNITIKSQGDDCVLIDGINTCSTNKIIALDKGKNIIIPISLANNKAGSLQISLNICIKGSVSCIQQYLNITATAGPIAKVNINYPSSSILAGSPLPIQINARDKYNNNIYQSLYPLFISSSGGTINKSSEQVQINDFRSSLFIEPTNISGSVSLYITNRTGTLLTGGTFNFIPGIISIQSIIGSTGTRNTNNNNLSYSLPSNKAAWYIIEGGKININASALPRLQINLKDDNNKPLAGPLSIKVEKGLIEPGIIQREIETINSGGTLINTVSTRFKRTTNPIIDQSGKIAISFLPIGKAGTDTVTIGLPDGTTKEFTISIKEGAAHHIKIHNGSNKDFNNITPGGSEKLTVSVQDNRGNTIKTPGIIRLNALGSLDFEGSKERTLSILSGNQTFTVSTNNLGGPGYIIGRMNNTNILPAIRSANVQKNIIPTTGLNGLYLSLLGSDRGNTTDNSKNTFGVMPHIFQSSDKILASTTEIVDPTEIGTFIKFIDSPDDVDSIEGTSYIVREVRKGGSTNSEKQLALFDIQEDSIDGGPSLHDATDPQTQVGRRNNQQHLSQFAQGKTVGEATILNASDILINYGDPLVMRVSKNPNLTIDYDDGIGQMLVNSPGSSIIKSLSADINNDGLEDVVTVLSNGTIERQKQYGGTESFVNMGPLLKIFGNIKDIYRSDTEGDGYDDMIIQLEDDTLRVYQNRGSVFDVDGHPVCLTGTLDSLKPDSIAGFDQWFIKDMDLDKKDDIITNNQGVINIIYGNTSNQGHSYISKNQSGCDIGRPTRQKNQIKTLTTFTTTIATGLQIVDDSLIRRKGLVQTSQGNTDTTNDDPVINEGIEEPEVSTDNQEGAFGSASEILKMIKKLFGSKKSSTSNIPDFSQFPVNEIIDSASDNILRRSVSPIDYMPIYESSLPLEDIRYVASTHNDITDQIKVYKTYQDLNGNTLRPNDEVKVTVHIQGLRNDPLTYINYTQGPWKIKMKDGIINGWNKETLNPDHQYISIDPQDGYNFIVDNIKLDSNNSVSFSYTLLYQGGSITKIKISDRNNDLYPDISLYPLDGCSKFFWIFENTVSSIKAYRDYTRRFVDLGQKVEDYANQLQNNTQNFLSGITNSINDMTNNGGNGTGEAQNILANLGGENMNYGQFFAGLLGNSLQQGGSSVNINTNLFGSWDAGMQASIDDTMKKLCGGNILGGKSSGQSCGKGLPVPFNMAFLAPGDFNLFGCRIPKKGQIIPGIYPTDNGFPVFAFPANLGPITPVGYLPLPFPFGGLQKGATDSYGYFGFPPTQGPYSSQIRIYLAPTLTMEVGVAICLGTQTAGKKLPSPLKHMAGNCIVTKIPRPKSNSCDNPDPNSSGNLSDQDLSDLSEFGQCTKTPIRPTINGTTLNGGSNISDSPFQIVTVQNGTINDPFPAGTYFGIVSFDKSPITENEDTNSTDNGDYIKGGKDVGTQLQGGLPGVKGLVKCIINDWMDRQLNYMITNLTNMQIGIYLPDISQLGDGFDDVVKQLNQTGGNNQSENEFSTKSIPNQPDTFTGTLAQRLRNSTINQSSLNNISDKLNNPFDQVSKLFEQTPLIRINTTDVQVKVPFIYAEDIVRYESYLKSRLERNKTITTDRESLFQGAFAMCGKSYNLKANKGGSIATADPNQIFNEQFITDNKQVLEQQDKEIKKAEQAIENCEKNKNDANSASCKQIIADKELIQSHRKRNDACMSFLFQGTDLNPNIKSIISLSTQSQKLQTSVRANMKVLEQYKRFPLQLYQWTHIVDRYLSETVGTVDNFLGSISLWLNTNATRFEQYVDAIITISLALKTRQAIINLSTDRQSKCSKCTVDNYDMYACSLGFLCKALKPPILRIPKVKIPNITLDLSHIDLGMEILLPKFQFIPTSVVLPQIPDLPQVPELVLPGTNGQANLSAIALNGTIEKLISQINTSSKLNIPKSLPNIPILPQPPTLPELPSFVPNITLELPVLPPAPKIPNISPKLEAVIKVASFVSKLYCIAKSGIGLVGEKAVKTRIEQLTQRKNEIPFFDNLNLSRDMSYTQDKLEGFDYRIDAFVNFTYNFSYVYDLIKKLADTVNSQTDKLTQRGNTQTNINLDELNNSTQQNFTLGYNTTAVDDLTWVNEHEESSLSEQKNEINKVLSYLTNHESTPKSKQQELLKLQSDLSSNHRFVANQYEVIAVQNKTKDLIETEHNKLSELSNQFKNYESYDKFLDTLKAKESNINNNTTHTTQNPIELSASLISGDQTILSRYNKNTTQEYLGVQNLLLDNYRKGLEGVTNSTDYAQAQSIIKEISYLQSGIQTIVSSTEKSAKELASLYSSHTAYETLKYRTQASVCESDSELSIEDNTINNNNLLGYNTYPYDTISAQVGGTTNNNNNNITNIHQLLDFSQLQHGITIEKDTSSGTTHETIVNQDYFSSNNQGIEEIDLNKDKINDIILRSKRSVWVKYGKQVSSNIVPTTKHYSSLSIAPTRDSSNGLFNLADDNGILTINGTAFKVASDQYSVKNLAVRAQDYNSFKIIWTNSLRQHSSISGYVIEINTLPDLYHLKAHDEVSSSLRSKYVLMLPQDTVTGGRIMIPNQLGVDFIEDYMTGDIIDIRYYKEDSLNLQYTFTNLPRSWYYTRIVSLKNKGTDSKPLYVPGAPWSHHVVAGQQLIADVDGPDPDVILHRVKTNIDVDSGLGVQGLINTTYNLNIQRNDPNGVRDNRIEDMSGKILAINSGATSSISGLYSKYAQEIPYRIFARDRRDNESREDVLVTINSPTISIDSIITVGSGDKNIISSLTEGMDEGIVRYERNRNNIRSPLPVTMPSLFDYTLGLDQVSITGGIYNQSPYINFYLPNDTLLANLNKQSGEITIQSGYINRIDKRVDVTSNRPIIVLVDKITNTRLFTIKLKAKNTTLQSTPGTSLINLSGAQYGSFNGGQCLSKNNDCMVTISPDQQIIINAPYHTSIQGTYNYNIANNQTTLSFSDNNGIALGVVYFQGYVQ